MQAKQWQESFSSSLFNGLSGSLAGTFSHKHSTQHQQRFAIYQNNVFYSLTQALGDLYPVIKKLVGNDFFLGTAKNYLHQYPPQQAAMVFFGWQFPQFLADFEHTRALPYLADIARLELMRHQAYHAEEQPALDPENFSALDPRDFENANLRLHASVGLLDSAYPIFSIWQTNQKNAPEQTIDLNNEEAVITVRHHYQVKSFHVNRNTYQFYRYLEKSQTVHSALKQADITCPEAIAKALGLGIQNGLFSQIHLAS